MSLQFYFGPSGSGKSRKLHTDMTEWAAREPKRDFLFLVPDQFTMQTQFDLVNASEKKGIMNIDVLSFGRLAHRVFEETGFGEKPVLDDTGKNLLLRKVAAGICKEMPVLGPNLHKIGYIHEVKSAISEFMQYGISPEQVKTLAAYAGGRGNLCGKLQDLQLLYSEFLRYIQDRFITTEETLELLTRAVEKSELVRNSVIVFDGFTGFTPIQNRLIQRLMELTERVIVSITIDINENPFQEKGEQELFYLSKKTVKELCRLAQESSVAREEDIYLNTVPLYRFKDNPKLAHLEKHLFRYPQKPYGEKPDNISITEAISPAAEAKAACIKIKEMVLSGNYSYRDIAVVVGDMETYGTYLERESRLYDIPVFMDRTRGLLLNPFIEFIRSSLKLALGNFTYESVFHYLRSGLADFHKEEVDRLENYVLALGIKGRKKWSEAFTRPPREANEEKRVLLLQELNQTREKLMEQIAPLLEKKETAGEYVRTLYEFITAARAQEKLAGYEAYFKSAENPEKAKEYAQVYRLVMELLEQIHALLADEKLTLQEFADIFDAGFSEITIGIIPGSIDRVVVGDMERTRLKQVKVLFFLGVNDGNIPKNNAKGGIISDIDREFLQDSGFELAPTGRQQMYIQRLYLYMNMTKPSEQLHMSYARINAEGKSIRPSYLIDRIRRLFPLLETEKWEENTSFSEKIVGARDGLLVFSGALRSFRERNEKSSASKTAALLKLYRQMEDYSELAEKITDAAFMQYQHFPLSREIARLLYGSMLENSVSRLEQYAACAYAHFLQYGLLLKEREEYSFEQVDLGNIYHTVLQKFSEKLSEKGYSWLDFPQETGDELLKQALEECAVGYGETILYSNSRYEYMTARIYRILKRTVHTLKRQLQGGQFTPAQFEFSFSKVTDLKAVDISLTEQEKMKLRGRIDRIDTCEEGNRIYVKVVDYKSGNKNFDLLALYYGLQLQLVVYMNVAVEMEKRKHPEKEIVPAALFYYRIHDPLLKEETEMSPETIEEKLLRELRMTGIVNSEEETIRLLDSEFSDKSLLIPVERKKDGSFTASSGVMSAEDYQVVSAFVEEKIKQAGREIFAGNIAINPCETGFGTACTYCAYKSVCRFDEKIPGFGIRRLLRLSEEEVLQKMKEEETAWQ